MFVDFYPSWRILLFTTRTPPTFDFQLGAGEVIQGWDKGLVGRKIGEVFKLDIPSDLAYGSAGAGDRIPPNSPLTFKIEILAAAAPEDQQWTPGTFKDIGINTKKLGLTDSMIEVIEQNKIGLNGNDTLIGGDQTDLLIGLKGNDRLVGNRGGDVLIGGKGKTNLSTPQSMTPPIARENKIKFSASAKRTNST